MRFDPQGGFGKKQWRQLYPINVQPKFDKTGLGYPNL